MKLLMWTHYFDNLSFGFMKSCEFNRVFGLERMLRCDRNLCEFHTETHELRSGSECDVA